MNPYYARVPQRAFHRCEYCQAPENIFNCHFEVDHVRPVANGGTIDLANLALACPACNLYKSNAQSRFDDVSQDDVSLYHPRRDLWSEHFRLNPQTACIEGVTSQGRATVAQLQINHVVQVEARLLWIELGLFP